MLALINRILDWFRNLFWKEEMELTLVGLQNSGKTTFVNVIASGQFVEDMIPTVGFNMKKITKGNVTIKLWDIGGQPRFRSMWERYCRSVNAIIYMVDAADHEKLDASQNELHQLLDKPHLEGIPVLVLGNKRDLPGALDEMQLIERLNLSAIQNREICCYSISCKEKDNIGYEGIFKRTVFKATSALQTLLSNGSLSTRSRVDAKFQCARKAASASLQICSVLHKSFFGLFILRTHMYAVIDFIACFACLQGPRKSVVILSFVRNV